MAAMPGWVDRDNVKSTILKEKRKSSAMVHSENLDKKVKKSIREARYKRAFKLATEEAHRIESSGSAGKHGNGLRAIAKRYNQQYLDHPGDKLLSRGALVRALKLRKEHGVSPPKRGRPNKVLPEITSQLAMQVAMMQAAGQGKATSAKLVHGLTAMTSGTKHGGTFNKTYALRRARRDHPEVFNPVMAKNDDDRRVEW